MTVLETIIAYSVLVFLFAYWWANINDLPKKDENSDENTFLDDYNDLF